jgi:transposase
MPRNGRRKQTRRVDTTPQGLLFDLARREAESKRLKPEFVDRNPHDLVLANFREHLVQTGHGWVLEMRSLLGALDWTEFQERYPGGGRRPYAPWVMMGLILYGTMKGVSSVRELERLSQLDVGAMWITGGVCPDYSVICRFVKRHEASLTESFYEQLTSGILRKVGVQSVLAGDGTTIEAAGSRFRMIKREAALEEARVAREAAQADPSSACLEDQAQTAERVAAAAEDRAEARRRNGESADGALACKTDPESTVQKLKRGGFAPAYIASVLANQQRIIVAQAVDSSSEIAVFGEMAEQAERTLGGKPQSITLDSRYHCEEVLCGAVERDLNVVTPAPDQVGRRKQDGRFGKADFKYDASKDEYACPAGKRLTARGPGQDRRRGTSFVNYRAPVADCRDCPLKHRCTKSSRGRLIRRSQNEELREAMREIVQRPSAKALLHKRKGAVEPVFSETRRNGMTRFRRYGLAGARIDWSLAAMAHNMRRWVALVWAPVFAFLWLIFVPRHRPSKPWSAAPACTGAHEPI